MSMRIAHWSLAIAALLSTSGCLTGKSLESKVPPDQVAYFQAQYGNESYEIAEWAVRGIRFGQTLMELYRSAGISVDKSVEPLDFMSMATPVRNAANQHLSVMSALWADAIDRSVRGGGMDFSVALSIVNREFRRLGVHEQIDSLQARLMRTVSKLDRQAYASTYQLYATLSQTMELAKSPTGSLSAFNSACNELSTQFDKEAALARIELTAKQ